LGGVEAELITHHREQQKEEKKKEVMTKTAEPEKGSRNPAAREMARLDFNWSELCGWISHRFQKTRGKCTVIKKQEAESL